MGIKEVARIAVLTTGFFILGCEHKLQFAGRLQLHENLTIRDGRRQTTIGSGTYTASAEADKNSLTLTLQSEQGQRSTVKLQSRRKLEVPENGEFVISAEQIAQNFSLRGQITTQREKNAELTRERENCWRTDWGWCEGTSEREQRDPDRPRRCRETTPGLRQVEFHKVHVTRSLELTLLNAPNAVRSGSFAGVSQIIERDYVMYGACL